LVVLCHFPFALERLENGRIFFEFPVGAVKIAQPNADPRTTPTWLSPQKKRAINPQHWTRAPARDLRLEQLQARI
jgi:hypothetical protein